MNLTEKKLTANSVFKGHIIELQTWKVQLPNGHETTREIILHPGAVAILASPKKSHLILVKQYRTATEQELWELPAGKLEAGEDPLHCAQRELREETGYVANQCTLVHRFYTSPGFANEQIYLYYATDLQLHEKDLDEDEFVEMDIFSIQQIQILLQEQQIQDAKTLVGLYWWLTQLQVQAL